MPLANDKWKADCGCDPNKCWEPNSCYINKCVCDDRECRGCYAEETAKVGERYELLGLSLSNPKTVEMRKGTIVFVSNNPLDAMILLDGDKEPQSFVSRANACARKLK